MSPLAQQAHDAEEAGVAARQHHRPTAADPLQRGRHRAEHHPFDVVLDEVEQPRGAEHDLRLRQRGPRLRSQRPVDADDGHRARAHGV